MLYRFVDQSLGGIRCCLSTGAFLALVFLSLPETGSGQTSGNSGMTTATSNPTEHEYEMMQIRAAAQEARGEAAAAQMARSADQAIEERHMEATLQDARETKRLKRDAQNQIKWQKAQNAYNKISADEMSTWRGSNGGVRVERNVPNEFMLQLREEERLIAAQEAAQEEEPGFGPISATKKMLSWRPFSGRNEEPSNYAQTYAAAYTETQAQASVQATEEDRGGFMSNIRFPRLPLVGGRSEEQSSYTEPQQQPVAVQTAAVGNEPRNVPVTATVTRPGAVPRISGAELVDGQSSVNRQTQGQSASQGHPQFTQSYVQTSEPQFSGSGDEEKKGGFFSFLKSDGSNDGDNSGGMFSFGKKKESPRGSGGIDASLFPSESIYTQPTGGELGRTDPDPVEDDEPQGNYAASSMPVEMPSNTGETRKTGGGFTIPKPNISIPKIGGGDGGGASKPAAPSNSIINNNGNSYYVVSASAQFMQYGDSQMESEIRAINQGMVVRMTKPGADWVGVQLPDGSEGVIQMKNLRAASSGEIPGGF